MRYTLGVIMRSLSIELDRQVYLPGEDIAGKIIFESSGAVKINNIHLSLYGEETLGGKNFWYLFAVPLINEKRVLYATQADREDITIKKGEYPFTFTLPAFCPPSFESANFGCHYTLAAKADFGMGREMVTKLHISVVQNILFLPKPEEIEFGISNEELLWKIFLEKDRCFIGDKIRGNFYLEHSPGYPPKNMTVEISAVGMAFDKNFPLHETVWTNSRQIEIKPEMKSSAEGVFSFDIPDFVPFSGIWNTFKIYWVATAHLTAEDGKTYESSAYFDVYKFYDKFWAQYKIAQARTLIYG